MLLTHHAINELGFPLPIRGTKHDLKTWQCTFNPSFYTLNWWFASAAYGDCGLSNHRPHVKRVVKKGLKKGCCPE
jgi:hypothetical protein